MEFYFLLMELGKTVKTFAINPKDIVFDKIVVDNTGFHILANGE